MPALPDPLSADRPSRSAAAPDAVPRPTRFLLTYALANAGGVIGFLPLLTLLLPLKVEGVAGEARLGLLTATVIAGAIAASLSNLLFGWLSDATVARGHGRGRRGWAAGGLIATALAYGGIALAATPGQIVLAVVAFQTALNALLAPLMAIMADEIPDAQKGVTGGLLSLANPMASGVLAILVGLAWLGEPVRLGIVVAVVAVCLAPLLLTRARPLPIVDEPRAMVGMHRRDLAAAWCARLLMQLSSIVLQLYLLYYFESVASGVALPAMAARVGNLLTVSFVVALPIAVAIGRLSDRLDRRKPFLLAAAIVAALGLVGMAFARDWTTGAAAFALFAMGSGVFLPLQNAFSMQLLPDPRHRGRDLGLLNLTNTLPSLLGPLLTWMLATPHDFGALMLALVVLTLGSGFAMLAVRGRR